MTSPAPAETVEINPVLGRLALALGEGRAFRLWSLLQHLNRSVSGSGSVFLSRNDAELLGLTSTRSMYRVLDQARQLGYLRGIITLDGYGWRIFIASMRHVNNLLRERADEAAIGEWHERERCKVAIPLDDFADWRSFCGAVFDGWIAMHANGEMSIPGYEIARQWGKCRQTVSTWRVVSQHTLKADNWGARDMQITPDDREAVSTFEESTGGFAGSYKGAPEFIYRRSNTYISSTARACRGQLRKFSRYGTPDGSGVVGQPVVMWDTDGPKPTREVWRRNFFYREALIKAREVVSDPLYYLVSRIKRGTRPVSQLWSVSLSF